MIEQVSQTCTVHTTPLKNKFKVVRGCQKRAEPKERHELGELRELPAHTPQTVSPDKSEVKGVRRNRLDASGVAGGSGRSTHFPLGTRPAVTGDAGTTARSSPCPAAPPAAASIPAPRVPEPSPGEGRSPRRARHL